MRTAVVSTDATGRLCERLRSLLRARVDPRGPAVVPLSQAEERLRQLQPELVVVTLPPDPDAVFAALPRIRACVSARVLAVGPACEPKIILRALHEGADQYLDQAEIESEVDKVLPRLAATEEPKSAVGRVVAVLGACGGSGATTLAVNLAAALAGLHKRSAVVDLRHGAGDAAPMLNLRPAHTLADLCASAGRLDAAMLESSLLRHESGVHVLAPCPTHADLDRVTPQGTAQALALVRGMFPHTLIDLGNAHAAAQVEALRLADHVLVVCRLEFPALRNTRRMLDQLDALDLPRRRVSVVCNRYGQPKELPLAKAEEALGVKMLHRIPDDPKAVNRSINVGDPVVRDAPASKAAAALWKLARSPEVQGQAAERAEPKPAAAHAGVAARLSGIFLGNSFRRLAVPMPRHG